MNSVKNNSKVYEFYLDKNNCTKENHHQIEYQYRGQKGWEGITQKICVSKTGSMSMGVSIIQPGGKMEKVPVAHEFCDFLLSGSGSVIIEGYGEKEVQEGDFLNIKKGVVRSSYNNSNDIIVGIWFMAAQPSYDFGKKEGNETV